jgi:hypothetical protein
VLRVRGELGVDPPELDVRVVVLLDGLLEVGVELLDLGDDRLSLSLLRRDGLPRRRPDDEQKRGGEGRSENDYRRPSGSWAS